MLFPSEPTVDRDAPDPPTCYVQSKMANWLLIHCKLEPFRPHHLGESYGTKRRSSCNLIHCNSWESYFKVSPLTTSPGHFRQPIQLTLCLTGISGCPPAAYLDGTSPLYTFWTQLSIKTRAIKFNKHKNRFLTNYSAPVIYVKQSGVCSVRTASWTVFQLHITVVHRLWIPSQHGFSWCAIKFSRLVSSWYQV